MLDLCMFAEGSKNEQEISVVGDIGKVKHSLTSYGFPFSFVFYFLQLLLFPTGASFLMTLELFNAGTFGCTLHYNS